MPKADHRHSTSRRVLLAGAALLPAVAAADVAETLRDLHDLWDVGNMPADDAARVTLESAIADLDRLAKEARRG